MIVNGENSYIMLQHKSTLVQQNITSEYDWASCTKAFPRRHTQKRSMTIRYSPFQLSTLYPAVLYTIVDDFLISSFQKHLPTCLILVLLLVDLRDLHRCINPKPIDKEACSEWSLPPLHRLFRGFKIGRIKLTMQTRTTTKHL